MSALPLRGRDLFGTRPALKRLQPYAVNNTIARIAATYIRVSFEQVQLDSESRRALGMPIPLCDENERQQCNRGRPEGERKSNIDPGSSEDCSDPQRA